MKYFKSATLLIISSLLAIFSTFLAIVGSGYLGGISQVAVSGFMSLMFPTIFGLASKGLGKDTKMGSSGLIMAIAVTQHSPPLWD